MSQEFKPNFENTDIKRLAQVALDYVPDVQDATRMPEDVGIDHVD